MKPRRTATPAPRNLSPHDNPEDAILWWRERLEKPLFVYFIQDGDDGPVKIGQALNPKARLESLQCGNPRPLILRAVALATESAEESLHLAWNFARIRGEWFCEQDEIIGRAQRTQRRQVDRAEGVKDPQRAAYAIAYLSERDIRPPRMTRAWA